MKRNVVLITLMILLFCGMCIIESSAVKSRPAEPKDRVSSVYMLAGEFRAVFANLLWIKAEQYHHEFIENNADWTRNKELMGLIELIVHLDPTFVEAYATGAYIYADGYKNNRKALNFLRQGISNNPKAAELYKLTAIMYVRRFNDPKRAIPYAKSAIKYAEDDWYRSQYIGLLKTIEKMAAEQKTPRFRRERNS